LRGLTDVDAITLSLIDLHRSGMEGSVAVTGITLAAITNTLVKGGIAAVAGGRALGLRVGASLLVALFSGGAALILVRILAASDGRPNQSGRLAGRRLRREDIEHGAQVDPR
jgi:hypothetical protein